MRSYIIFNYPVPEPVYSAANSALKNLSAKQRAFVLHVLVSNVVNLQKIARHNLVGWVELGVELPCELIAEHFGSRFRAREIDSAILSIKPYSTAAHRCTSFAVRDALLDPFLDWSPASTEAASSVQVVNLFDGKPYKRAAIKQWENGTFTSPLIRRAINSFGDCPFDGGALDEHLEQFERLVSEASEADKNRLLKALRVDRACAARIRAGCIRYPDGWHSYRPEYRTSGTGRITEVGGGAQNCTRAMKVALFDSISNLKNYDLRGSQTNILLQELEDAKLPRDWVEKYLGEPHAAQSRADALGISKDCFKRCLYATIMGASLSNFPNADKNQVYACLLREFSENSSRAMQLLPVLNSALQGLKNEVQPWHRNLMKDPACPRLDQSCKKVRTLKNACGQAFKLEGYAAGKLARKAAAFVLQGQEAAFIHRLTVLGSTNGFVPVSNQHDGLVVIGKIPRSIVDQAAKETGLRYATLDEKPFL